MDIIKLKEKLNLIHDYWNPKIVGELNGQHIKLAKIKGEFIWHKHEEEDEFFMVLEGQLIIEMRDKKVVLNKNDCYIVPKGVEHKPIAIEEVSIMMFEPMTTLNTGEKENERTVKDLERI